MTTRTRTERYTEPYTRDGITVDVVKTRQVAYPALPRDWDRAAVRLATGLVLVLTSFAVVWSTWSIGSLLHGGVGYLAAAVFDIAWGVCLLLEWMARYDAAKRAFPRRLGWLLLVATMGVIFWHGMVLHSVSMAVAGALVSAFAKLLWLGVMKHIDRELSDADAQWVAAQISAANAKMAVAQVRRQAARTEHRAAAELLAMEAEISLTDSVRALSGQEADSEDSSSGHTITDTVRTLVALGVDQPDSVLTAVRTAHGPEVDPKSVTRILRRVTQEVTA